MEIIEAIKNRCSVRKYKDKPVSMENVLEILDIAKEAPSSGNMQNWRFIIVTDEKKRKEISTACLKQSWMNQAPVHIIVCNDYKEVVDSYEDQGKKYSIQNCAIVSQNIMLAAMNFNLGTCFVGAFDDFALRRILAIPESIDVEAVITLGYPNENEREKKYELEIMTYVNQFGSRNMPSSNILGNLIKPVKKAGKKLF